MCATPEQEFHDVTAPGRQGGGQRIDRAAARGSVEAAVRQVKDGGQIRVRYLRQQCPDRGRAALRGCCIQFGPIAVIAYPGVGIIVAAFLDLSDPAFEGGYYPGRELTQFRVAMLDRIGNLIEVNIDGVEGQRSNQFQHLLPGFPARLLGRQVSQEVVRGATAYRQAESRVKHQA